MSTSAVSKRKYSLRNKSPKNRNKETDCVQPDVFDSVLKSTWSSEEITELTEGILTHGHFSDKVLNKLPLKSWPLYRKFFIQVAHYVKQQHQPVELIANLENWMKNSEVLCKNEGTIHGPLEIAVILKLLSMDGVLEEHPKPQLANGVDFGACYRLLYQSVLGYPLQPLNEQSIKLFSEIFLDLTKSVENDKESYEKFKQFLHNPEKTTDYMRMFFEPVPKKQARSYGGRKKSSSEKPVPTPAAGNLKEFVQASHVKNVLESVSYDPFKYPLEFYVKGKNHNLGEMV